MTFFICNFILVMQTLWRLAEYIMGKGIELEVYAKFFYYLSASTLPITLPLAILLAALMTFGNFGEKCELLAMKAAGVSLFSIMKPLILLIVSVACLSYVFQEKALPNIQLKFKVLTISIQQKSPALSIPEGAFYSDIDKMTIYVKNKDPKKKLLKDIMIYDFSQGFEKVAVTLADSARLRMTEDKLNLVMTLYHGEGFSNFDQQQAGTKNVPYRRDIFKVKEMVIPIDDNFSMIDESYLSTSHISKNSQQLRQTIDSVGHIIDSIALMKGKTYSERQFLGRSQHPGRDLVSLDSIQKASDKPLFQPRPDSLFQSLNTEQANAVIDKALKRVQAARSDFEYQRVAIANEKYQYSRSGIEYYKKLTLSVACIIFFFIGAPLGAIIGKGGIGMPAVTSVILFVAYYLIDTAGQKLVKNGEWSIEAGMWLSTAILLPLGIFLTYKSVNDSTIFNVDSYLDVFKKIFRPKLIYRYLRISLHSRLKKSKRYV